MREREREKGESEREEGEREREKGRERHDIIYPFSNIDFPLIY